MSRLPVALICGLPGAGKSTLADHVREDCENQHRVDCLLLNQERAFDHVRCLAERGLADYLLLELTGTGDPEVAAAQLSPQSRAGAQLAELVRLDAIVTVIDTTTVLADFASWHRCIDRGFTHDEHDERSLAEVIAEQVEFADVIVLNKAELASARAKHAASVLARSLNPDAVIIEAKQGRVPGRKVLFTYAFEFTQARERALDTHTRWCPRIRSRFAWHFQLSLRRAKTLSSGTADGVRALGVARCRALSK
jgi:G3E family GTPase